MKIYLVGGAVRDELLDIPVRERDWVVVGATPAQMLDLGYRQVGKDFPVFLHPDTAEEYALARRERKTAPGYHGFEFDTTADVTLEEDLGRRDLTINAIARDAAGDLIDPYGGSADVQGRVLRHVAPAFREDPVRVLRIARFAARFAHLGFTVHADTQALMQEMVDSGEVDHLQADRVWRETSRALTEAAPAVFFRVLRDCGALNRLFPEIDALFGVPQPPAWHPEIDTGIHTLMVLEQAAKLSPSLDVRFAALTHDLGKGLTPREIWPKHTGHERESVRLVRALCKRLPVPNRCRDLALAVAELHGIVHRALELKPRTVMKVLDKTHALRDPERFEQFLLACEADSRGRAGLEDDPYPQAVLLRELRSAAAAVTAAPLMKKGLDGAALGAALRQERIAAIRSRARELRESAIKNGTQPP